MNSLDEKLWQAACTPSDDSLTLSQKEYLRLPLLRQATK